MPDRGPRPNASGGWPTAGAFIYIQTQNGGSSILVNTSIDDSLGLLAKSGAWVAFCRFLVGEGDRVRQFCFRADERPVLELPEAVRTAGRTFVDVENCDGGRTQAAVDGRQNGPACAAGHRLDEDAGRADAPRRRQSAGGRNGPAPAG